MNINQQSAYKLWSVLEFIEKYGFQESVILVKNIENPCGVLFHVGFEYSSNEEYIMSVKTTNSTKVFSSCDFLTVVTMVLAHITAFVKDEEISIHKVSDNFKNFI